MFIFIFSGVIYAPQDVEINETKESQKITSKFLTGPVRHLAASDKLFSYVGFDNIYTYDGNKTVGKIEFSSGWAPAYGILYCNMTNKLYVRGQPYIVELDLINGTSQRVHGSGPHSRDGIFAVSPDGLNFYDAESGFHSYLTSFNLSASNWGQSNHHNLNLSQLSALAVTPDGLYVICIGITGYGLGIGGKEALFIYNRSNFTEAGRAYYPGSNAQKVTVTGNSKFAVAIGNSQAFVFNLQNWTYQGNISLIGKTRDIVATTDKVYVTSGTLIYELDPKSTKVLRKLNINGTPTEITISSDYKKIFVVDGGENKIVVLNSTTGMVSYEIDDFGPAGWDVGVTSDNRYAVIPDIGTAGYDVGFFGVVDLQKGTTKAIPMPIISRYIAIKPNSYEFAFYNVDTQNSNLYFCNLKTETLKGPFSIKGNISGDLFYGPNGRYLFFSKFYRDPYRWEEKYSVVKYDIISKSSSEISIDGIPTCIRPTQNLTKLFIGYQTDNWDMFGNREAIGGISEFDLSNNSLLKTIKFYTNDEHGDSCYSMEIDTEREIAFVEFWGEGTKIINMTSNQTIKTLTPRSGRPFAFNSNKSILWMGSYGTGASYWNPPLLKVQTDNFTVAQSVDIPGYRTLGLCVYKDGLVVTTFGETILINFTGSNLNPTIVLDPKKTEDEEDTPIDDINTSKKDPDEKNNTKDEGMGNKTENDIDGDNYKNDIDKFPNDPNEWSDTDSDGIGDNSDLDIDNDDYINDEDKFPYDPYEWADSDNDGLGDNITDQYLNDRDNDGYQDSEDNYPDDPTKWKKESFKSDNYFSWTYIIFLIIIVLIILISLYFIKKRK